MQTLLSHELIALRTCVVSLSAVLDQKEIPDMTNWQSPELINRAVEAMERLPGQFKKSIKIK